MSTEKATDRFSTARRAFRDSFPDEAAWRAHFRGLARRSNAKQAARRAEERAALARVSEGLGQLDSEGIGGRALQDAHLMVAGILARIDRCETEAVG